MQIREANIRDLKPYEKNAKKHDAKQVANVANSIRRFGWQQPIVIDDNGVVVIGHCRLLAAKKLGMKTVPVTVASGLTDEEIRELRIADNKTNESPWDFELLADDLEGLEFDGFDFSALGSDAGKDWFERTEKDGAERQEGNEEYNEFLEKFEAKKTTDDCYTPDNVYKAVADWVANRYGLDADSFVRPFFPGGDYQKHNYPPKCAVVDNPPFSILAEIIDFYVSRKIPFFLFGPSLAVFNYITRKGVTAVAQGSGITYENGACVRTSFITNMEGESVAAFTDCALYEKVEEANAANEAAMHANLPKYEYPDEVLTAAKMSWIVEHGVAMRIMRDESVLIRALDAQKEQEKAIYGCGLLLSERAAAERAAAERAAVEKDAVERPATKWELSDRERRIVQTLGKSNGAHNGNGGSS